MDTKEKTILQLEKKREEMNWHKMQSKRDKKEKKKEIKNEYWRHILKVILLEDELLESELFFYVW